MELSTDFSISSPMDTGSESGMSAPQQALNNLDADAAAFQQALGRQNENPSSDSGSSSNPGGESPASEQSALNANVGTHMDALQRALERETRAQVAGERSARAPDSCPPKQSPINAQMETNQASFQQALERGGSEATFPRDAAPLRERTENPFSRAMEGSIKAAPKMATQGAQREVTPGVDPSLVESLFRGVSMPGAAPTADISASAEVGSAAPAQLDAERIETLVSRILVNSPEKGASEVRLTLNDNILKGAEISITRDLSGNLSISLSTKDSAAFQTLVASRQELLESLEKTERGTVSVEVRDDSSDEGNMQRRSRGLDGLEEHV